VEGLTAPGTGSATGRSRSTSLIDRLAAGAMGEARSRVTKLAARQFRVLISIVSIVDTDRIWFKAHHARSPM
jgi:hypothetical protein